MSNSAPYAAAQDGGSGKYGPKRQPYRIVPKRKRALHFFTKGGVEVFTRGVMHPGVRATRFLYNAADAEARQIGKWLHSAMGRAAKRF